MQSNEAAKGGGAPSIIWSYDLSPITARMAKKGTRDAPLLEREFRRFAALRYFHPDQSMAPSLAVDDYWHEFVIDTTRYRDFCDRTYGEFLDHIPDQTGTGMAREFANAKSFYRMVFGEPDSRFWQQPGNSMPGKLQRLKPPRGT